MADFGARLKRLQNDFHKLESGGEDTDIESGINRERSEDGEYESTKGRTNQELLKQQKDHLQASDNKLDAVLGVVQATRFEAENFGAEARLQNKMLDNLNNDIDRTEANMIRVEGKMKNLIKASSMCKLWSILLLEFVILLVLIFLSF